LSSASALPTDLFTRTQHRVLNLYAAIMVLMLILIALLIVYAIRLGPLVGPGVEQSFGFAVALLFLSAGVIVHVVDRAYRVWPFGRSVRPAFPGFITDRGIANGLKILVIVCAGAAIAYVIATLITS
jgi:tetrahydromethanopterin S-methyltransferase subunit E